MQTYYKICVILIIGIPLVSCMENDERNEKLISSFQIVKFPNDPCTGSGTRNGTCYTSQECSDKKGTSAGSCADGFGVCCTFVVTTCGGTTSENQTDWTIPTTIPATENTCSLDVCSQSTNICSIRLDFTAFQIHGPSTVVAATQVRRRFGTPVGNNDDNAYVAEGSSFATNCLLDLFSVTSASPSTNPPAVCGLLTGEHMYVEADTDRCNKLQFNLAATSAAFPAAGQTNERGVAAQANRNWDIKITQIECTSEILPPPGCTKYFWGAGLAHLESYNFRAGAGSTHLASQHERFCIRRERGNCIGCFSSNAVGDVRISGTQDNPAVFSQAGGCCGYHTQHSSGSTGITGLTATDGNAANPATITVDQAGQALQGSTMMGFDCLIIPGASVHTATGVSNLGVPNNGATTANLQEDRILAVGVGNVPAPPQICGNNAGLGIGAATLLAAAGDFGAGTLATANTANDPIARGTQAGGSNVNLSICTRNVPFTLEFLSDDLDGLGTAANEAEVTNAQNANRGFTLDVSQIACTANAAG